MLHISSYFIGTNVKKVNPAREYDYQEAEHAGWLSCHATFEAACSDEMRAQ